MFGLLQRARLYANLTPGERALLKIVEGLIVSAAIAGIVAALPAVSTQNLAAINWMAVGSVFVAAAGKTLYDGVAKYFKAFGDPPLPPAPPTGDTGA
jgi:hypothetical protein